MNIYNSSLVFKNAVVSQSHFKQNGGFQTRLPRLLESEEHYEPTFYFLEAEKCFPHQNIFNLSHPPTPQFSRNDASFASLRRADPADALEWAIKMDQSGWRRRFFRKWDLCYFATRWRCEILFYTVKVERLKYFIKRGFESLRETF